MNYPNLSIYDPNSPVYYAPAYRLQVRIYAKMAQELLKSILFNLPLSDNPGFIESYILIEVSREFPGYIAYPLDANSKLEVGDVIVFRSFGPRIINELKDYKFKKYIYLNKTMRFIEIPSGIIFNRFRSKLPSIEREMNVSLNKSISFLGYDISSEQIRPNQPFSITYYWKSIINTSRDYRIFVHLIPVTTSTEINNTIRTMGHNKFFGMDHEPLDGTYPTSKWVPGVVVAERYEYRMPNLPDGTYEIRLGMFDIKGDKERLEVIQRNLSDGANRIIAGSVKITNAEVISNLSQSIIFGSNGRPYFLIDFLLYMFFYIIRLVLVSLISITIIALVYLIYRNFGCGVSFIYFWALCCSDWIIFYARNYFWMIFLYFIPFVLAFWLYPKLNKAHKLLFFTVIFFAVFIRLLLDMEYVTNLILIPLIPIIYFDIYNKESNRKVLQDCFLAFVFGVAGFLAAISINIFALYNEAPGNFAAAINFIKVKILDRTGIDNFYAKDVITGYAHPLFNQIHPYNHDAISQILYIIDNRVSYEQVNVVTSPIFQWAIPLYLIELIVLFICYWEIKKHLEGSGDRKVYSLCVATIASFVASNSWAILTANGHMKYHLAMNPIIFYLPFLLTAFILISVKIWEGLNAIIELVHHHSIDQG